MAEMHVDGYEVVVRLSAAEAEDWSWAIRYHGSQSYTGRGWQERMDAAWKLDELAAKTQDYSPRPGVTLVFTDTEAHS